MIFPMKIRNKEKRRIELARQSNIPIYSQKFVDKLESELTALRSQVAELQRKYDDVCLKWHDAVDARNELQHQLADAKATSERYLVELSEAVQRLDEQAKQEPVAWKMVAETGEAHTCYSTEQVVTMGMCGWKESCELYALPPNLPAMIEQARAEELQQCWDKINAAIKPGELPGNGCDEIAQRNGLILASNIIMEAIRARGETK